LNVFSMLWAMLWYFVITLRRRPRSFKVREARAPGCEQNQSAVRSQQSWFSNQQSAVLIQQWAGSSPQ
jgi:hypothetical protein